MVDVRAVPGVTPLAEPLSRFRFSGGNSRVVLEELSLIRGYHLTKTLIGRLH